MLIENHKRRLRESLEAITWAIDRGAAGHQRTIGFHASTASVDLLNLFLHQEGLLDTSSDLNHRRLGSRKLAEAALPFDFPRKDELIPLLCTVENARDPLCYGRPRSEEDVEAALVAFGKAREIFRELRADES